uniref:Uncharacterized protein n=1 Tax=Arundo donax TaxID=35708 RepID=A0A0A8Z7W4_ARUDO
MCENIFFYYFFFRKKMVLANYLSSLYRSNTDLSNHCNKCTNSQRSTIPSSLDIDYLYSISYGLQFFHV